jgi:hypothetical protein
VEEYLELELLIKKTTLTLLQHGRLNRSIDSEQTSLLSELGLQKEEKAEGSHLRMCMQLFLDSRNIRIEVCKLNHQDGDNF